MADYGMEELGHEINVAAARLARAVADEFTQQTPDKPRFVAGVLGPTNRTASISPDVNDPGFRNVSFDDLVAAYAEATHGLVEGGVDLLLIETIFDTLNAKAAVFAVEQFFEEAGTRLPVMISGTITDQSGRTLSGQTDRGLLQLAASCAAAVDRSQLRAGRRAAAPVRGRAVAACRETYVSAHPNAGLPNEFGEYDETPEAMARELGEWAANGFVNIIGGCCGTTPAHIKAIAEAVGRHPPRKLPDIGAAVPPVRPGAVQHRSGIAVRQCRRTHQRHRLGPVQAPDHGRRLRDRAGRGAPAGGKRRPDHRRQHGRGHAGFDRRPWCASST